ncbi:DUF5710 domain-containing protein [Chitinophaga flava]|uniref:DUF5710 domain-containing protein n=1 Tax=Chitinophaga flava TaxID=2259036 RepID=A0A365XQC7_9BACT|nr:DUF5710 domain-containing protein [Chitinophaga flava]RBL88221.1 hypothetical protein DF182_16615 [Chitinophaga flava]
MSLLLNVPAEEETEAKSKGALWDANLQTWYLPDINYDHIMEVDKWITDKDTAIILSDEVIIAHGLHSCLHCQQITPVIALGSDFFYEKDINEKDEAVWFELNFFTLFQQVSVISPHLFNFFRDNYPHYKQGPARSADGYYWCNHCEHCGQGIDDTLLFADTGHVFTPETSEAAAAITLRTFPFKYAPHIDADYHNNHHLRLINEFAVRSHYSI